MTFYRQDLLAKARSTETTYLFISFPCFVIGKVRVRIRIRVLCGRLFLIVIPIFLAPFLVSIFGTCSYFRVRCCCSPRSVQAVRIKAFRL